MCNIFQKAIEILKCKLYNLRETNIIGKNVNGGKKKPQFERQEEKYVVRRI